MRTPGSCRRREDRLRSRSGADADKKDAARSEREHRKERQKERRRLDREIAKLESDAKAWAARAREDELVRSAAPDRWVALQAELESTDAGGAEAELAGETSLEELESLLLDA